MLIDKQQINELYKSGKVRNTDDLNEVLKNLTKDVLEVFYQNEMTAHLGYEKHQQEKSKNNNSRNGSTSKTVKSKLGNMDLEVPRDCDSTFEPTIIKKRQTDITGLEDKVISLYGKGFSIRDIKAHIIEKKRKK